MNRRSSVTRSASTLLLLLAAVISAAAMANQVHAGFHPLVMASCLLPLQCAGLLWAWQRASH